MEKAWTIGVCVAVVALLGYFICTTGSYQGFAGIVFAAIVIGGYIVVALALELQGKGRTPESDEERFMESLRRKYGASEAEHWKRPS